MKVNASAKLVQVVNRYLTEDYGLKAVDFPTPGAFYRQVDEVESKIEHGICDVFAYDGQQVIRIDSRNATIVTL